MSEVTEEQLEDMEVLFVQTAASLTSDGGTITLRGLSPSTLYFAVDDRMQLDVMGQKTEFSIVGSCWCGPGGRVNDLMDPTNT